MKILTCLKIVPDLTMMPEHGWSVDQVNTIDTSYIKKIINCFDESAAELAISLKQQALKIEKDCQIDAVTISDASADIFLRTLLALEYQNTTRIELEPELDLRFSPEIVAKILARYYKQSPYDLVLLGIQSSDGNNAQTATLLAEEIGIPCITNVNHIEFAQTPGELIVFRSFDQKEQRLQVKLPIVLAIGNTPNIYRLRIPTIKQKMAAGKKSPCVVSIAQMGLDIHSLKQSVKQDLISIKRQKNDRTVHFIEGESPQIIAKKIYEEAIRGKI